MNLMLSADDELVRKARQYAAKRGTSLNRMIRDYMKRVTSQADIEQQAREFARLARESGGRSRKGFIFDREDVHRR